MLACVMCGPLDPVDLDVNEAGMSLSLRVKSWSEAGERLRSRVTSWSGKTDGASTDSVHRRVCPCGLSSQRRAAQDWTDETVVVVSVEITGP